MGGKMRRFVANFVSIFALLALMVSCARHPSVLQDRSTGICENQRAFRLGVEDGEEGQQRQLPLLKDCEESDRPALMKRYRNGFELGGARAKSKRKSSELPVPMLESKSKKDMDQTPPSWICEVEASSKVFTGVGQSEVGALKAARDNCGAHFQAKECSEFSECRQSL